ncbi:MAG: spore cortex biosynthesis protein YabQ [Clostridia bacterium]|nr:spore cortex biosynthesis protein YabQ [Clostridia bacterium]
MSDFGQIYVFFCCLLCGAASGVIYDFLYLVKKFIAGKRVGFSLDVLFFLVFAGIYIFVSVLFNLPPFRLYMFCGCMIGLLIYLKSLHLCLTFVIKKLYNIWKNK